MTWWRRKKKEAPTKREVVGKVRPRYGGTYRIGSIHAYDCGYERHVNQIGTFTGESYSAFGCYYVLKTDTHPSLSIHEDDIREYKESSQ